MRNTLLSFVASAALSTSPAFAQSDISRTPTSEQKKSEQLLQNNKDVCIALINGQAYLAGNDARNGSGSLTNSRQKEYDIAIKKVLELPACKKALGV